MNSLFIAYDNDESCHCVVRICPPARISFYYVCFNSFYFFLFFLFSCGFYYLLRSEVAPRFTSGVSRGELLQPCLVFLM